MMLVAISASYGTGGSRIASSVARRLDVPFLDRAIPMAVAAQLEVPYDDAASYEQRGGRSWIERVLSGFIGVDTGVPAPLPAGTVTSEDFRRATEEVLLKHAAGGQGVILGRASVIVLRDDPRALRVRLDGPAEHRLRLAMERGELDRDAAERAMRQVDRVHTDYARQFYGVDLRDPTLYHLVVDPTAIAFETCVELIERAARALAVREPDVVRPLRR